MIPAERRNKKGAAAPKGWAKFPKLDVWTTPPTQARNYIAPPVTHHVPVDAADRSLAALIQAYTSGGNNDMNTAASLAAQQTHAQIAALHQAQAQANAQAASRAAQIGALGQQAAQFTQGLGDQTAAQYRSALGDTQGLAAGFAGQTRADADAAAAQAQQMINASGGSATAVNEGGALGNVLYGLGGKLPGDVLQVQGLGSTAAARMVPVSLLQYGQQGAAGALQAGADQAASYQPDITRAIGSQAGLAQQYLSDLQSSRQNQLSNMLEAYKLQQSAQPSAPTQHGSLTTGVWHTDPRTGKVVIDFKPTSVGEARVNTTLSAANHFLTDSFGNAILSKGKPVPYTPYQTPKTQAISTTLSAANGFLTYTDGNAALSGNKLVPYKPYTAPKAARTEIRDFPDGQWLVNLDTGQRVRRVGALKPNAPSTSAPSTQKIGGVTYQWDAKGKRWVKSGLPVDKTKKSDGKLTSTQVSHLRAGIVNDFYGVPEQKDANGKVVQPAILPKTYQETILDAQRHGYTLEEATKAANRHFKPGVRGRPLSVAARKRIASTAATYATPPPFLTGG